MNFSAIFIRRPVATILLAIAMVAAGAFAYQLLPVAALPNVDFPVISVSASLPGASPETMSTSVATPLIKQFSTIPAIDTMTAKSSQGSTSIVIQFDLSRDIDQAAADVQAAIARTNRQLPANMTTPPSYRKSNPADAPIMLVSLQSDSQSLTQLDTYGEDVMSPALSQLDGVGEVQVFGAKKYAVRVDANPAALTARGIKFTNVIDPSVSLRSYVRIGTGNVIMANCFFALGVSLGDNNFFASHTVVEHHSTVGSHCAIGPRCTTSGRVQIGDRVRFGMHVAVEPYLKIGSDSVVASGITLTSHVAERTIVKAHAQYSAKPL